MVGDRILAKRIFLSIAGVVLVISFASPVQGLDGAGAMEVGVLNAMHLIAMIGAIRSAEWAARPRWNFGSRGYREREIPVRTAVVTGAAAGIGRQAAQTFAEAGAQVVIGDIDAAGLAETAALIGPAATMQRTDVSHKAEIDALAALALERHGRIDVWANVAGTAGPCVSQSERSTRTTAWMSASLISWRP